MSLDKDALYALLPAIYRTRDIENGQPLYALCTVLAEQSDLVEENIRQLYDDQFIETCAPWVIPYIGDLVGSDTIFDIANGATGRRAEVANTIGYRRRKGTLLALEQVTMDVSGRATLAVEFFKRLIVTESMRHVRPGHASTANIRRFVDPTLYDSPFASLNRTIDVRRIAPRLRTIATPDPAPLDINLHGGGRFNIPDVGVYLWRWKSFQITQAPAFTIDSHRYLFSPLGCNTPLFNAVAGRDSFSSLTIRLDVQQPILRHEFRDHKSDFYGESASIALYLDGVFATDVPVTTARWNWIYIHHSKTADGDAVSLAHDDGLSDHFVIGNGGGCVDGEIQMTQTWNRQESITHPPAGVSIKPGCISICVVGDFDLTRPTPTQQRRLLQLVGTLQTRFHIPAQQVSLYDQPGTVAEIGHSFPVAAFRSQILP